MARRRRIHEERPQPEEVRPPPAPPAPEPEAERPGILRLASAMGNRAFSDAVRATDAKGIGPTLAGEDALVDARGAELARQPGPLAPPGPAPPGAPGRTMGVTATVPGKIRHGTTPPQMTVDRIPPRVGVPVPIAISGWSIPMAPVEVAIENGGGGNGTCTLDGAATTTLTDSGGTPTLVGVDQTAAGRGAQLRVVVRFAGAVLARSNAFAVAAIPQNYSDTKVGELTGPRRGLVVQDGWQSDSGVFADLDQTEISERVEETSASGVLAGLTPVNSGYLPGDKLTQDTHSTPASVLTGPGERIVAQTCMFKDHRTGTTDIPMTNSGYTLSRSCITFGAGTGWFLITTKVGAATTAKGISSQAGAGAAVAFQQA